MPRRSRRSELALGAARSGGRRGVAAALLTVALALVLSPASAHAEWKPSGALTASLLVESGSGGGSGPALGGGLAADLWQSFGALRLGAYAGLHAVSGTDEQALVFTPFAFSGAVVLEARRISFEIRIRAGGFGGAVHDHGFVGGLYLGTGVFLDINLSSQASIGFGGDLHLLVATADSPAFDSRAFFAPGITLVYRPRVPDDAP